MRDAETYYFQKAILMVFLLFGLLFGFNHQSQGQALPIAKNEILLWLQNADSQKISNHFDAFLSFETPENKGSFNKMQATLMLAQFFAAWPADSVKHQESGQSGTINDYIIGDYYSKGQRLYFYILSRKEEGKMLIFTLNIKKL